MTISEMFQNMYESSFDELFVRILKELSKTKREKVYEPYKYDGNRDMKLEALDEMILADAARKKLDVDNILELVKSYHRNSVFRAITIATLNHEGFIVHMHDSSKPLDEEYHKYPAVSQIVAYDDKKNMVLQCHFVGTPRDGVANPATLRRRITDKLWINKVNVLDSNKLRPEHLREFLEKLHTIRWNNV